MPRPEPYIKDWIEVGTGVNCYPMIVPEGTAAPFIIYSRTSTTRDLTMESESGHPMGLFAVEIYTDSYSEGKDLAAAVMVSLLYFEGAPRSGMINIAEESDGQPVFINGRDVPTYVINQSYEIQWSE